MGPTQKKILQENRWIFCEAFYRQDALHNAIPHHNLGSRRKLQKMARENFSIGAFYNITKNQDNLIKTLGRDSFLRPKTPKNTSFLGVTQPPGVAQPYILGDTTKPRRITYVQVWSKSNQRRLRKTLHKQTNKQTDRQTDKPTDTTKIMVTGPWTKKYP